MGATDMGMRSMKILNLPVASTKALNRVLKKMKRLEPARAVLMICDIQDRFRPVISKIESVIRM